MKLISKVLFVWIILGMTSCSGKVKQDGDPCPCLQSVEVKNEKVLEGDKLPKDLTCVVASINTSIQLADEIEMVYKALSDKHEKLEAKEKVEQEIKNWLGGAYVGECGNLYQGVDTELEGAIDVNIKASKLELWQTNGVTEKPPHVYKAYVTYEIKMTDGDKEFVRSFRPVDYILIETCNRYLAVQ